MIFLTAWTIIAALSGWDRVDDDSTESSTNMDSNTRSAQYCGHVLCSDELLRTNVFLYFDNNVLYVNVII